ncbi:MAG: homogentisate 1,2-dioxygenase, partial [Lutimonas sp.]
MPRYHRLGKIPPKRHTQFKNPGGGLYQEELFGTAGFVGMSSLIYHLHPPTVVTEVRQSKDLTPAIAIEKNMRALSFKGFSLKSTEDY